MSPSGLKGNCSSLQKQLGAAAQHMLGCLGNVAVPSEAELCDKGPLLPCFSHCDLKCKDDILTISFLLYEAGEDVLLLHKYIYWKVPASEC